LDKYRKDEGNFRVEGRISGDLSIAIMVLSVRSYCNNSTVWTIKVLYCYNQTNNDFVLYLDKILKIFIKLIVILTFIHVNSSILPMTEF